MKKLYGTGVALITPFTETLEIDYKALKKLLRHTAKGVDYYVVMGTTGEAATCSEEEKKKVLEFVKGNNPNNLPIVFGIGGNNTHHVLDSIKSTDFDGVTALLSVSPYYSKPPQEGIIQHFKAIADKCPVPVILYNVPGRTSSNLTAETTLRLAEHENIIGTKEASAKPGAVHENFEIHAQGFPASLRRRYANRCNVFYWRKRRDLCSGECLSNDFQKDEGACVCSELSQSESANF